MKRREFVGITTGLTLLPAWLNASEAQPPITLGRKQPCEIASTLTSNELRDGVCLLDVGDSCTEISLYLDYECRSATKISFGMSSIASIVRQRLELSLHEAEATIHLSGHAFACMVDRREQISAPGYAKFQQPDARYSRRALATIIQEEVEKLFLQALDFCDRSALSNYLCGVLVQGRIVAIPGVAELGEEVFHWPVRTASPTEEYFYPGKNFR